MVPHPSHADLRREIIRGAAAGLLGTIVPGLARLGGADASAVHTMHDVAVGLAQMVFFNAFMSTLIPAIITFKREARNHRFPGATS